MYIHFNLPDHFAFVLTSGALTKGFYLTFHYVFLLTLLSLQNQNKNKIADAKQGACSLYEPTQKTKKTLFYSEKDFTQQNNHHF